MFPTLNVWHELDSVLEQKGHSPTTTDDPNYHGKGMPKGILRDEDTIGNVRECVEHFQVLMFLTQ